MSSKFSRTLLAIALVIGCDAFIRGHPGQSRSTTKFPHISKILSTATTEMEVVEDKTEMLLRKADMLLANAPSAEERMKLERAMGLEDAFAIPAVEISMLDSSEDKTEMLLRKADMLLASAPSVEERKKMEASYAVPTGKKIKDVDLNIDSSSLMEESAVAAKDKTAMLLRKADMLLANAPPVKRILDAAPSAKTTNGSMDKTEMLLQKADMLLASSKR